MFRARCLFFLLLALFVGAEIPAEARTLSELRTDTRVLLNDSGTASARYRFTDAQLNAWLNECQRDAVAQTWALTRATSFELVADTQYYSLPDSVMAVKRVLWEGRLLEEKSPQALDRTKEWEEVEGTPQYWFVSFASRTLIGIQPIPADSSSTGTVKVEYATQPTDLSADADVPFLGVKEFYAHHHLLTYCAAGRLALVMGRSDLAPLYIQLYQTSLPRLAMAAAARPSYSPAVTPATPGGAGGP